MITIYFSVDNADNPYLYWGDYGGHFYVLIDGRKAYQAALVTDKIWHYCGEQQERIQVHPPGSQERQHDRDRDRDIPGCIWGCSQEAQETAAQLYTAILTVYDIPLMNLLRNGDVTTKTCPAPLMPPFEGKGSNWTWQGFRSRVAELMGCEVSDILQKGCHGEEVRQLQGDLISLGYFFSSAGADGSFGDGTFSAVEAFQRACGLLQDGIVCAETRKALGVAAVQAWMNRLNNVALAVDGQYGPKTKKAHVVALQKCLLELYGCRITVDGSFGPDTKAACWTVAKRDKGLLVSIFQAGLLVHGIRDTGIDAIFGDVTEAREKPGLEQTALLVLRRLRDCSAEHEAHRFCQRA